MDWVYPGGGRYKANYGCKLNSVYSKGPFSVTSLSGEIEVSIGQSWSCIFMFRVRISLIFEQKIAISLRGKIQTLSCRFALQGFIPPKNCEISKSGGNIFCIFHSAIIDYFIKEFGKMELFLCQKFLMNCRKLSRKVWIIKKMENKIWSW